MGVARRIKYKYKWSKKYNNTNVYQFFTKKNFVRDLFIFKVFSRVFSIEQSLIETKILNLNLRQSFYIWKKKKKAQVFFINLQSIFLKNIWQIFVLCGGKFLIYFSSPIFRNLKNKSILSLNRCLFGIIFFNIFLKVKAKLVQCFFSFFYFKKILNIFNIFLKQEVKLTAKILYTIYTIKSRLRNVLNFKTTQTKVWHKKPRVWFNVPKSKFINLTKPKGSLKKKFKTFFSTKFNSLTKPKGSLKKKFKTFFSTYKKNIRPFFFFFKKYLKSIFNNNLAIKFKSYKNFTLKFNPVNLNLNLQKLNFNTITEKEIQSLILHKKKFKDIKFSKFNLKNLISLKKLKIAIKGLFLNKIKIKPLVFLRFFLNKITIKRLKFKFFCLKKIPLNLFRRLCLVLKKLQKKVSIYSSKPKQYQKKLKLKTKKFFKNVLTYKKVKKVKKIKTLYLKKYIKNLLWNLQARYSIVNLNKFKDPRFMFSLSSALLLPKISGQTPFKINFTLWQQLLYFYQQNFTLDKTYPFFDIQAKNFKNIAFFHFPQIANIFSVQKPLRRYYLLEEPLLKFYKVSKFFREKKEKWFMSYFRFRKLYKNTYLKIQTLFDVNAFKEEARVFSIFLCKIIKFLVFCPFVKTQSKIFKTKIFWRMLKCLLSKKIKDFLFVNLKIKNQQSVVNNKPRFFSDFFYNQKFNLPTKIFEYFNQKRSCLFVSVYSRLFKKYGNFRDILSKIPFRLDLQLPNRKFRRKTEKHERFQNLKIIRRYYGNLTRKQLSKYRKISLVKNKGTAFYNSILLLESRIDFFSTKCNFFTPVFDTRNFVLKGFLIVNGKQQSNINYRVDFGDLVSVITSFILNFRFYFTSKYIHNLHGEGGQILLAKIYPKYVFLASIAILSGYMPWMFCISLITENFFFDKVISENIGRFYYISV